MREGSYKILELQRKIKILIKKKNNTHTIALSCLTLVSYMR